jgi:hypothetical protein
LIQSALVFILGILAKDLRNLEGIVDDVFMTWVVDGLERYSKVDVLVTLPKKKYEKTIVQDFITLVKGYDLGVTTIEPLLLVMAKSMTIKGNDFLFTPSENLATFLKNQIIECCGTEYCLVLLESAIGTPESKTVRSFCDAGLVSALWDYLKDRFGKFYFYVVSRKDGKVDHLTRILRVLINLHGPKYSIQEARSDVKILLLYFIICQKSIPLGNQHEESYFDLQTHLLGLMTNLVENNAEAANTLACVSKFFS